MGEPSPEMDEIVDFTCDLVPQDRPRYLMGVGMPRDILAGVRSGIDMFDCVIPTRMGRTGWAFTAEGIVKMRNAKYAHDESPLDPECDGPCCRNHTRAYLRHCFNVDEMLGPRMVSLHNIRHFMRMMARIREAIRNGTLGSVSVPS